MGWAGITPYSKLQWAAVTTQYWLIKEPPQKWDPVRVWGGKREEELGLGGLNTSKLGTGTGHLGTQPWHLLAMPVFRASAQGRCCTCRDTCQGHEPGAAFCPLTILSL